jgi:poly-gamma-glutamate synthase PgsB/CapB
VSLIFLLTLVAIAFVGLIGERIRLNRRRKAVPLLIAVTGTRGKSSVARMLASVLRQSGRRVLAKTTGSEAAFILPDGSEKEIRRRGRPSIIEQKRVIRLAARLGADAAVVEVMSIHPENHFVEAHHLLKPDIVLVTNFRVDHTGAVGETREAVASVLALDVPRGGRAFVPQGECFPEFRDAVEESGGEVTEVPAGVASSLPEEDSLSDAGRFGENLDLVCVAARALHIDDRTIREGIRDSRGDVGSLGIWRYRVGDSGQPCILVNAFAANDPESTSLVHDSVMAALGVGPKRCVGLLNLRPDRGDRTLQWVGALREGFLDRFARLYVMGLHAQAVARRLKHIDGEGRIEVVRAKRPEDITQSVLREMGDVGGLVFGFGNIGGPGEALVAHWSAAGERVEV